MAKKVQFGMFWIGGWKDEDGTWKWVDGRNITMDKEFNYWGPGQPNGNKLKNYCMSIGSAKKWNDVDCLVNHPFLCEIDRMVEQIMHFKHL